MTLPKPDLDDRTFEDLVAEARILIPRLSPKWTDHNVSDPGITLVELLAWLTEASLYRLNLVTDRDRLKYLKLLGIRSRPSRAASVDLTFREREPSLDSLRLVAGTWVMTEVHGNKIVFELALPLTLTNNVLVKVLVDEVPTGVVDRTEANNHADYYFFPFGPDPKPGSTLYLGFSGSAAPLALGCTLFEQDLQPAGEHLGETVYCYANARLRWYYGREVVIHRPFPPHSQTLYIWYPVDRLYDGTRGFKQNGRLVFSHLPGWTNRVQPARTETSSNFWLKCVVEEAGFEYPPRIEMIRLHTVPASHGKTLFWHQSNGEPDQRYSFMVPDPGHDIMIQVYEVCRLPGFTPEYLGEYLQIPRATAQQVHDGILASWENPGSPLDPESIAAALATLGISDDLALEIFRLTETGFSRVADFTDSSPDDNHVVIDPEKGEILFGDGIQGRIPPARSWIHLRQGGGPEGNLGRDLTWTIEDHPLLKIRNPRSAAGGLAAESIDDAFDRFLLEQRQPVRAVTSKDFEYLARNTPGLRVAKAKAITCYPYEPTAVTAGPKGNGNKEAKCQPSVLPPGDTVTVVVVPGAPPARNSHPVASSEFLSAICRHVDRHRLLGTRVQVLGAVYVRVSVNATVQIVPGKSGSGVKTAIVDAINRFLDPISGGPGSDGWPIGRTVYRSYLMTILEKTDGVSCIRELVLSGDDGSRVLSDGSLSIPVIASVYPGDHSIQIIGEGPRCEVVGNE